MMGRGPNGPTDHQLDQQKHPLALHVGKPTLGGLEIADIA